MISVQKIVDLMKFQLDAEGSDRYLFDQDFKPSINSTIQWLVYVFNRAFEQNKLTAENLRELIRVKVFVANNFSRIKFDEVAVGDKLWSYLGIFPEPVTYPANILPPALVNDFTSIYMDDVSFVSSEYSANKLTIEKWNLNKKNIFQPGNLIMTGDFKSYAYISEVDYSSSNYAQEKEITIRPDVSGKFVAISYLKVPDEVTVINSNIEFPDNLTTLFVQKALNFISIKQGDNTNLFGVSDRDVSRLIKLIV